jgi:hypothetical protein
VRLEPRDEHVGFGAKLSQDRDGYTMRLFEQRKQQVGGFDARMASTGRMVERQLAHQLCGRGDSNLATREGGYTAQVFVYRA